MSKAELEAFRNRYAPGEYAIKTYADQPKVLANYDGRQWLIHGTNEVFRGVPAYVESMAHLFG